MFTTTTSVAPRALADHLRSLGLLRDELGFDGAVVADYFAVAFLRLLHGTADSWADAAAQALEAGIDVELPAPLHTHSRRQAFYFDDEGLLRRHDYVADIVGWWARGAHLWRDFETARGMPFPRERHVVARVGRATTLFVALHAQLDLAPS